MVFETVQYNCNDDAANTNVADVANGFTGTTTPKNTEDMSVSGRVGKGLFFDGANDLILENGNISPILATGVFSFAAWIKPDVLTNGHLLGSRHSSGDEVRFHLFTGNKFAVVYDDDSHGAEFAVSTTEVTTGLNFVVGTVDVVTTKLLKLYLNNVQEGGDIDITGAGPLTLPARTNIGVRGQSSGFPEAPGSATYYEGMMDIYRIAPFVFTPFQINLMWNNGFGTETDLETLEIEAATGIALGAYSHQAFASQFEPGAWR